MGRLSVLKSNTILLMTILLLFLFIQPVYARSGKKITHVQVSIVDIDLSSVQPQISLSKEGKTYEVEDFWEEDEFPEDYFDSESREVSKYPVYIIALQAEDGYYFSGTKATLKGAGAVCVGTCYKESNELLYLRCEFRDMTNWESEIGSAGWSGTGFPVWDPVADAAFYEIRVFYKEDAIGSLYITQGTSYDIRPLMTAGGEYYYKIRQCMADGSYGNTITSEAYSVGKEEAAGFKKIYEVPESETAAREKGINAGWQSDQNGWWYRKEDGMYEQDNWQQIDDIWYYFDTNGYMVTDQWITWKGTCFYLGGDGKLQS